MSAVPPIILHTKEGHHIAFYVGRDCVLPTGDGSGVVEIQGERVEVQETKKQIDGFLREAKF